MFNGTITSENIPDLAKFKRVALEPGTPYRFRLAALNGCGRMKLIKFASFSSFSSFRHSVFGMAIAVVVAVVFVVCCLLINSMLFEKQKSHKINFHNK